MNVSGNVIELIVIVCLVILVAFGYWMHSIGYKGGVKDGKIEESEKIMLSPKAVFKFTTSNGTSKHFLIDAGRSQLHNNIFYLSEFVPTESNLLLSRVWRKVDCTQDLYQRFYCPDDPIAACDEVTQADMDNLLKLLGRVVRDSKA